MTVINVRDFYNYATQLLADARSSILVRCNTHVPFVFEQKETSIERILLRIPNHVDTRILLGVIESEGEYLPRELNKAFKVCEITNSLPNCRIRISHEWSGMHSIVVDRAVALEVRSGFGFDGSITHRSNVPEVQECILRFERHWDYAHQPSFFVQPEETDPAYEGRIRVVAEQQWAELIEILSRNPNQLYSLPPRKFEELVAVLLEQEGLEVQLTPQTSDGGRDILAWHSTPFGPFLYFVECKRYAPHRPVGVGIVRELFGVVESEGANGGILITTSRFTNAAWGLGAKIGLRMKLADYQTIVEWINKPRPV